MSPVRLMSRRRVPVVLPAAALLLAAGGCASDDAGPLEAPANSSGSWCIPDFAAGSDLSHGSEVLSNASSEPLTITEVRLVDDEGFEIVDSYQRSADNGAAGVLPQWPPAGAGSLRALTTIAPDTRFNLVLHLRSTGTAQRRASFSAVEIDYEQDGRRFTETTTYAVVWKARCR